MNCSTELENLKEERTDRKELENQTKKERTSRKRLENLNRSKGTGESEKEEETFREGFDYESVEKEAKRSERSRPRNKKEDHNFRNALENLTKNKSWKGARESEKQEGTCRNGEEDRSRSEVCQEQEGMCERGASRSK